MAGKRGNGGGNGKDPMLAALHSVVTEVHGLAAKVTDVVAELKGTNVRLERVEVVLLETRHEQRETNARLGRVEERIETTNARLETTNARLGRVEERLETTNARLGRVEERLDTTNAGLGRVEERLENIRDLAGGQYRLLEERVAKLEARLPGP